ncbi:MAG: AAA family ATPase [Fimbriimonadaceae bacterium]|nr:AAA family ATPase [Fimbriimonadaceae bacterium]
MQTITFYSYKGGVGRTLAVANVARGLAMFGRRVFLLDFDLEAPGLLYKMRGAEARQDATEVRGVTDYILEAATDDAPMPILAEHVLTIAPPADATGALWLMPAGAHLAPEYWSKLAHLDWHRLFFSAEAAGVPLFLDLKARIEQDFQPDYLLIDSRTGVTEIGGVATSLLADLVVLLFHNNAESIDGTRALLASLQRRHLPGQERSPQVIPVLSRVPEGLPPEREAELREECGQALGLAGAPGIEPVVVLHNDPGLQLQERVLVSAQMPTMRSRLLADYLALFRVLTGAEALEEPVREAVAAAQILFWEDREKAVRELDWLAKLSRHPYALRAAALVHGNMKDLPRADYYLSLLWQTQPDPSDRALWQLVLDAVRDESYSQLRQGPRWQSWRAAIDLWLGAGSGDELAGRELATALSGAGSEGADVCSRELVDRTGRAADLVQRIQTVASASGPQAAIDAASQHADLAAASPEARQALAVAVLDTNDRSATDRLLRAEWFDPAALEAERPDLAARCYRALGHRGPANRALEKAIDHARASGQPSDGRRLMKTMTQLGFDAAEAAARLTSAGIEVDASMVYEQPRVDLRRPPEGRRSRPSV